MAEYIEREAVLKEFGEEPYIWTDTDYEIQEHNDWLRYTEIVKTFHAADVVEVDRVALMFKESFGDSCACNYNGNDEWLPLVCDFQDECPYPQGVLDCWKQFVKHFGERKEG